ncbi:MAG TPA: hypothetical protein VKJ01_02265 [Candidatus Solibacter sp.]|nr:hypothetical protein [Candidatus Solibacter sp.]
MNAKALICWILVGIPLAWGLYTSVEKAKPLFGGALMGTTKPADPAKK